MGLNRAMATKLVAQTALGASTMASQEGSDPSQLRQHVTSPGGTTEAALYHLAQHGVDEIRVAAVNAAYTRAKELASLCDVSLDSRMQ